MNSTLDLSMLLIARQGNEERLDLPDLFVANPPRHAARGRESDSLVIYLSLTGNSPLTPKDHSKLLEDAAHLFYKTTGSVTAALRTVAETLNLQLLDRNLRNTGGGRQAIGQLLLAAMRGENLYIAESGAVQAYCVKPDETQALYDLQTSGRGLGLSQSTPVRFLQVKLAANDYLVLSTIPASSWPGITLLHPAQLGLESLRHQLVMKAGQEYNAVILQAQAGTGKIKVIKRKPGAPAVPAPARVIAESITATGVGKVPPPQTDQTISNAAPVVSFSPANTLPDVQAPSEPGASIEQSTGLTPTTTLAPDSGEPDSEVLTSEIPIKPAGEASPKVNEPFAKDEINPAVTAASFASSQVSTPSTTIIPQAAKPLPQSTGAPLPPIKAAAVAANTSSLPSKPAAGPIQPAQPGSVPIAQPNKQTAAQPSAGSKILRSIGAALTTFFAALGRFLRNTLGALGRVLLRLLKNLLPDADVLHLPASTLVFITIAIPLILAVVGGMVFVQRGQAQQYQVFFQQATEKADYAATLTNPLEQRLALQTALGALDKAEEYSVTSESQALRVQLTTTLDNLDAVKRLDYKQAIVNGLPAGVNVTRILAAGTDLYLLDGSQGSVLHAVMTSRGYELDPTFKCGPTQGYITVGQLLDIVELPPGGYENASIVGIDGGGNLLYCVVGGQPYSASLAPPNTGLGSPTGISLDRGDLYVLDPTVNAVWIYRNMKVSQPPRLFFGDTVPPMQDVIDLEVYNDDLYLLHADGRTTKCTYSGMVESPTRCDEPYTYSDNRAGRAHGPVIEDTTFTQLEYSTFPEHSIFYLDSQHQAIYYFSVLLTLQYQYQPKNQLADGVATAFAINTNRIAFLAVGNNVYYAAIP